MASVEPSAFSLREEHLNAATRDSSEGTFPSPSAVRHKRDAGVTVGNLRGHVRLAGRDHADEPARFRVGPSGSATETGKPGGTGGHHHDL